MSLEKSGHFVEKELDEQVGHHLVLVEVGRGVPAGTGEEVLEIGYLFQKAYWHQGYAAEAAMACKEYAFSVLKAPRVCSIVRNTNLAAQKAALRTGMRQSGKSVKNFRGKDMEFFLYTAERDTK